MGRFRDDRMDDQTVVVAVTFQKWEAGRVTILALPVRASLLKQARRGLAAALS